MHWILNIQRKEYISMHKINGLVSSQCGGIHCTRLLIRVWCTDLKSRLYCRLYILLWSFPTHEVTVFRGMMEKHSLGLGLNRRFQQRLELLSIYGAKKARLPDRTDNFSPADLVQGGRWAKDRNEPLQNWSHFRYLDILNWVYVIDIIVLSSFNGALTIVS